MNKKVLLNTVENVKKFVTAVSRIPEDISLKSGKYIVDAKSIMGIFSLDLSKPIDLVTDDDVWEIDLEPITEFFCE